MCDAKRNETGQSFPNLGVLVPKSQSDVLDNAIDNEMQHEQKQFKLSKAFLILFQLIKYEQYKERKWF